MAKNTYLVLGVAALTAGTVMLLSRRATAGLPSGPVAAPTPSPAPAPPPSAALPPPIYLPPPRPSPTPPTGPSMTLVPLQNPADLHQSPDSATAARLEQVLGLQLDALGVPSTSGGLVEVRAADWLRANGTSVPYGPQMLYWAALNTNQIAQRQFY